MLYRSSKKEITHNYIVTVCHSFCASTSQRYLIIRVCTIDLPLSILPCVCVICLLLHISIKSINAGVVLQNKSVVDLPIFLCVVLSYIVYKFEMDQALQSNQGFFTRPLTKKGEG